MTEFLDVGVPADARILCVDDDDSIGELLTRIVRTQLQCGIETAESGTEGLRMLGERSYDVVVIDYLMPGMDGGELYRRIELEHPETVSRILFITGDILSHETLEEIRATGRPYLMKPFGIGEVTNSIRQVLSETRGRSRPRVPKRP